MNLLHRMRRTKLAGYLYRRLRTLVQGPGWGGFHRDRIYRGLMLDLLEAFPFTSFIETGTYHGYSTELVASTYPKLPVYTSEVMQETFDASRRFLSRYKNIQMALGSSDDWVGGLLKAGTPGAMPLFFLDAHWQTYWPLRAELRHISDAGIKAVIVVDDFEVPGHPEFGFDIDGGGELTEGLKCNLDYIRPSLGSANRYRALFPKYTPRDAFGESEAGLMRGHIVLFQNMDQEYDAALARPFLRKHYDGHGEVK